MPEARPARPGPKRSERSREAILVAAFESVLAGGHAGLTIEGIAARAGVGKQTVYRWWPTKGDVLLEALAFKADLHVSVDDHGSYRRELEVFLRDSFTLLGSPGVGDALRSLMAQAQLDPDFGQRFRTGFLDRRRAALTEILERAQARGDAPRGVPLDLIPDVVFGMVWYRVLVVGHPLDEEGISRLVDLLDPVVGGSTGSTTSEDLP